MRDGIGEMAGGLVFSAAAAAGIAMVGWLAVRGGLPVFDGTSFIGTLPGWGGAALGAWMVAVALVSLRLPVATLVVWGGRRPSGGRCWRTWWFWAFR